MCDHFFFSIQITVFNKNNFHPFNNFFIYYKYFEEIYIVQVLLSDTHHHHHHHHVVPPARISLTITTSPYRSSPLAGLQGYITYPHRDDVCMSELVVLLLLR